MRDKVYYSETFTQHYLDNGKPHTIICTAQLVSYGDQTPHFSITGIYGRSGTSHSDWSGGCIHDEIVEHFPFLQKYVKWHLVFLDEPLHYIPNTVYWAGFLNAPEPSYDHAKSTCKYGVLPDDLLFDFTTCTKESLIKFLKDRLPALMKEFDKEMKELFPNYDIKGR